VIISQYADLPRRKCVPINCSVAVGPRVTASRRVARRGRSPRHRHGVDTAAAVHPFPGTTDSDRLGMSLIYHSFASSPGWVTAAAERPTGSRSSPPTSARQHSSSRSADGSGPACLVVFRLPLSKTRLNPRANWVNETVLSRNPTEFVLRFIGYLLCHVQRTHCCVFGNSIVSSVYDA
jgi:hypothetical protein